MNYNFEIAVEFFVRDQVQVSLKGSTILTQSEAARQEGADDDGELIIKIQMWFIQDSCKQNIFRT